MPHSDRTRDPALSGPARPADGLPSSPRVLPPQPLPLGRRLLRLGIALALLWLVVYGIAPLLLQHVPPLRRFAESNEAHNQNPGALYYTDVPDSTEAEMHNRSTIRFFGKHGGDNRREGVCPPAFAPRSNGK